MDKKVAVLLPCYNEEVTIKKVINDFQRELPNADIYVYNNNSSDNSYEIAKHEGAIVVNEYKQGKGNVVRSMFRDIEADIYVMVDSDDTYPASAVHELIKIVEENKADMVVGDRISNGTYKSGNKRNFHEFGNNLVKDSINFLFKANLKDIMTGYRVFNRDFVKNMPIISKGFEIETEMTFHALDRNYKIVEVPIEYKNRPDGSKSKLNTFSDGFKVLSAIFKMLKNYRPFLFFGTIFLVLFIVGLAMGIPVCIEFFDTGMVERFPTAILSVGIIISSLISFTIGILLDTLAVQHKEEMEILRNINREMQKK